MRLRKGTESPKEEDKEKQIIPETKRQTEVRVREKKKWKRQIGEN